jgi:hypothetical protein
MKQKRKRSGKRTRIRLLNNKKSKMARHQNRFPKKFRRESSPCVAFYKNNSSLVGSATALKALGCGFQNG